CGSCAGMCAANQVCNNAKCTTQCGPGLSNCSNSCVDLNSDDGNCGGCGVTCNGGETCVQGQCACPSGLTLCNGICVDTQASFNNCGACNVTCATGEACLFGKCEITMCPNGLSLCG